MLKILPWSILGIAAGFAVGFAMGQQARSRLSESVKTDYSGGVLTVEVDTYQASRSQWIARYY